MGGESILPVVWSHRRGGVAFVRQSDSVRYRFMLAADEAGLGLMQP